MCFLIASLMHRMKAHYMSFQQMGHAVHDHHDLHAVVPILLPTRSKLLMHTYVPAFVTTLQYSQLSNYAQLACLWQVLDALLRSGRFFTMVMSETCCIRQRNWEA